MMDFALDWISPPPASGGSITFVGSDVNGQNGTTSLGLTLPTHTTDDFGVIFVTGDGNGLTISITVASGWTELIQEDVTAGRDRRHAIFYKKFTSASETDPTVSFSATEQWAASVHVFRGVDTTTPFDTTYQQNNGENLINSTAPAITTVNNNSTVLLLNGMSGAEFTAAGAPTGYTLGEESVGPNYNIAVAYLLDSGAAGTKTPGAWTHSGTVSVTDYTNYTLALRAA